MNPDDNSVGVVYRTSDLEIDLECPGCSATTRLTFPLLTDWRDRRRLERLAVHYPFSPCSACGQPVETPAPVIVLRPGDPISVLVGVTPAAHEHFEAFQTALADHAADETGVIPGQFANTDAHLISVVAARYSGFAIASVPADGQEWATGSDDIAAWIHAMRVDHPWPNLRADLAQFITQDSPHEAEAVFRATPSLQDPTWEPVLRSLGRATAAMQPTSEGVDTVRERMRHLSRLRLTGAPLDTAATTVVEAFRLITDLDGLQRLPGRTQSDIDRGVAIGDASIVHATESFGPDHPLTLTAVNDTAALLLDDTADTEHSIARARELLSRARVSASAANLPIQADVTTNAALALLRQDRIVDADQSEAAIDMLRDALHLHQLVHPDEPRRALSATANLASLMRSRLVGDQATNLEAATDGFDRALALATADELSAPDTAMLETNRLSAIADLAALRPDGDHDDQVLAAIRRVETALAPIGPTHPVRVRATTNIGSILLGMLYRNSTALPDTAEDDTVRWLTDAVAAAHALRPDDAARLLASSTLAAAHFRRGNPEDLDAANALLADTTSTVTGTAPTRLHHLLFQNYAQLHLGRGDWDGAIDLLTQACDNADAVIQRATSPSTRLAHVAAAGDLYQRLAFLHAHRRHSRDAIHTVERSRARWRNTLGYQPDRTDQAVSAKLQTGTAVCYLGVCGLGSYAVVLVPGSGAGAWTSTAASRDVATLLQRLEHAEGIDAVESALDDAARLLGQGLLDQLLTILETTDVTRLALVVSGALAGLPVAALPVAGRSLDSRYTVEYLIGIGPTDDDTSATEPTPDTRPVVVVDPTGDLPFARNELTSVRRWAPHAAHPPPGVGIRGWLLEHLAEATTVHLACHARYDPQDPFQSRFVLGANSFITIADLADVHADHLRLVVATCCQSGVVDQTAADELVGLAHALVAAGADSVIAALWDIDDISTSLLVARLYQELGTGRHPADALRAAQLTLRHMTMNDLADADATASWLPDDLRPELDALRLHPDLRTGTARPFAHPAAWSALVYVDG